MPKKQRISGKLILKAAAQLLAAALLSYLMKVICDRFLQELWSAYEWFGSLIFVISGLFLGLPGVVGCSLTYFVLSLNIFQPALAVALAFSKLPVALAAFLGRKQAGCLDTMRDVLVYTGICLAGCLISFFNQCYYSTGALVSLLGEQNLYTSLNLLSSNFCSVAFFGIPLCALIFRLLGRKTSGVGRNEKAQVRAMLLVLPAFLVASLFCFIRCLPDSVASEECWCKVFIYSSAMEISVMLIEYFLIRWKKQTLIGVLVLQLGCVIWGIFAKDPLESLLIVGATTGYILIRILRFDRLEKKLGESKGLRIVLAAANTICMLLLILANALTDAILVLPLADGTEPYTIILGAPVQNGEASDILVNRMDTAEVWAKRNPDTLIFITGGTKAEAGGVSEADMIGQRLIDSGVQPERIVFERNATTTLENFQNIRQMFMDKGLDTEARVTLLSSEFHYVRSTMLAAQAGFHHLTYVRTGWDFFSNILWSFREAAVLIPRLF